MLKLSYKHKKYYLLISKGREPGESCETGQCVFNAICNSTNMCECKKGYTAIEQDKKPTICKYKKLLYFTIETTGKITRLFLPCKSNNSSFCPPAGITFLRESTRAK